MKVLVIFGSKSDANIYEPLKARLLHDGHEVDFRLLSVHRSPELLDEELANAHAHAVVAGAGLAAHLPGILASKIMAPVFGIPCAAALGGVDSLFSMLQMPFGIPVLTSAPDQYNTVADTLFRLDQLALQYSFDRFNLICERHKRGLPHFAKLLERAGQIVDKTKLDLQVTDRPLENELNICLVDINPVDPECPLPYGAPAKNSDEVRISVPVLSDQAYRDPYASVLVARRIQSVPNGLWTGINNVGNAMLAALLLANAGGAYSPFLTNAKKGYVHA